MKKHVFREFVELINDHNPHELSSKMTDDHTFIDAQGNKMTGIDVMTEGWKQYFALFPDYWIDIDVIMGDENIIYAFGSASGTYTGHISGDEQHFFKIPAAFRAEISGEKVKTWQVIADTKIPFDIIAKNTATNS